MRHKGCFQSGQVQHACPISFVREACQPIVDGLAATKVALESSELVADVLPIAHDLSLDLDPSVRADRALLGPVHTDSHFCGEALGYCESEERHGARQTGYCEHMVARCDVD